MRPMDRRTITLLVIIFLIFSASGCLPPAKPPPAYYTLDPGPASELTGLEHGLAIGIGPLWLAPHLKRLQIVTRESNTQLRLSESHQWAEPLQVAIYSIIAIKIASELNTNSIYEFPLRRKRPLDYRVAIDVLRLDGRIGGEVECVARWIISSGDGKKELVSRISRIVKSTQGEDYDAFIQAESRAVAALGKEIADAIKSKM